MQDFVVVNSVIAVLAMESLFKKIKNRLLAVRNNRSIICLSIQE